MTASYVATRSDGRKLLIDDLAYRNTRRHGLLGSVVAEAWRRVPDAKIQEGQRLRVTVNMPRIMGTAAVIKAPQITPTEQGSFARRKVTGKNAGPLRVVEVNGELPQTSLVTLIGDWLDQEQMWMAHTAYPGPYFPPQPWAFDEIALSKLTLLGVLGYWCRAAFFHQRDRFVRPQEDTWARIIEAAARIHHPHVTQAIQYEAARDTWRRLDVADSRA